MYEAFAYSLPDAGRCNGSSPKISYTIISYDYFKMATSHERTPGTKMYKKAVKGHKLVSWRTSRRVKLHIWKLWRIVFDSLTLLYIDFVIVSLCYYDFT